MSKLITFGGNHYRRDTTGWYRVYDERAVPIHHVGTEALDEIERLITENRTHVAITGCLTEQARSAAVVYDAEIERLRAELDAANTLTALRDAVLEWARIASLDEWPDGKTKWERAFRRLRAEQAALQAVYEATLALPNAENKAAERGQA